MLSRFRYIVPAVLTLLVASVTGCLAADSACDGEFVEGNDECGEGCGVPVVRYVPQATDCRLEEVTWCVRPRTSGAATDDVRCIVDTRSGEVYAHARAVVEGDVPSFVTACAPDQNLCEPLAAE